MDKTERINIFIKPMYETMRKYQKENNIKGQCLANCQFLSDSIKETLRHNGEDCNLIKVRAVYVFGNNSEETISKFLGGHMIVVFDDDTFYEPSYDIYSLKNKAYFTNFSELRDFINTFNNKDEILQDMSDVKTLISQHIQFTEYANQINNGKLLCNDKEYYNKQADYIEKKYRRYAAVCS
tara:strand:- start:600 stop:1142 length:543 start_codon:yes stop_codon:yes gene_type:complete